MTEYIDRQAAIDALEEPCKVPDTWTDEYAIGERMQWEKDVKALNSLPSVDVQPLRHGHWETIEGCDGDELYRCSECGTLFILIDGTPNDNDYWFCPHCGADLRGEQDDDTVQ